MHPDHRRRGIYREMTQRLLRYTAALGFDCVESLHAPSNNPILLAKLGLGFRIVGIDLAPMHGWSVKLSYFHSAAVARVYEYRCGLATLDGPRSPLRETSPGCSAWRPSSPAARAAAG